MEKIISFIKKHSLTSTLILVLLIFAISSLASLAKYRSAHYFGTVTSMSQNTLTIADKQAGDRNFLITNKTKVRAGRKDDQTLQLGQDVFVVARRVGTTSLEALEIRIFAERP